LTVDRFTNGLTRPFFGWVSDRIGRENTMAIAFALEGLAMTVWLLTRDDALLFVLLSGVVFFGWGEIFSLFPSTLTDTFGTEHATANYGCLYIAQGIGSILGGPLASLLHESTGNWISVFSLMSGAPNTNRTCDLPLRRGLLYPLSYRGAARGIISRGLCQHSSPERRAAIMSGFDPRRGGRVVDCGRLEICCTAMYRGFESLPLRQFSGADAR
jgi:MFS family permease